MKPYIFMIDVTHSTDGDWMVFAHRSDGSCELVSTHWFAFVANRRALRLAKEAYEVQGPSLRLEANLYNTARIVYGQDPRARRTS